MKHSSEVPTKTATTAFILATPDIGMRVERPSARGYATQAIRESGERGGLLLGTGTNFTTTHNRDMGDAMELWNAHHWQEAVSSFQAIWQQHPDSPWAAEAELHEACYLKYNARYDEAEERFLSVLNKYPNSLEIQNKVLRYLPHLYAQTGRYQTGLDLLEEMKKLPLGWQERQYIENYARIFARAKGKDDEDRLCGTKALALALAAQNDQGESLRNVSLEGALKRQPWGKNKSTNPAGFSLQELADLDGAQAVELDLTEVRAAASPGHPVLVHLKSPESPKCFTFFKQKEHPEAKPLSGHFVVVEAVTDSYVDLLDPDLGRTRWSLAHFQYRWSGAALRLANQKNVPGKPVARERALNLRGGCCGSPPPDPTDECGDGEEE
jgi:tetratricopeptide (TPR) repeat protein